MAVKAVVAMTWFYQNMPTSDVLKAAGDGPLITGEHRKWDLRYSQKRRYLSIFTKNIWFYLLWSPVISNIVVK